MTDSGEHGENVASEVVNVITVFVSQVCVLPRRRMAEQSGHSTHHHGTRCSSSQTAVGACAPLPCQQHVGANEDPSGALTIYAERDFRELLHVHSLRSVPSSSATLAFRVLLFSRDTRSYYTSIRCILAPSTRDNPAKLEYPVHHSVE